MNEWPVLHLIRLQFFPSLMLVTRAWSLCLTSAGVVYYTVLGERSNSGAIKRAYIPNFESGNNNPVMEINLDLKYIVQPDGLAVDWVGR